MDAGTIDVLKYGALGLGLVILVYSASLLKQELARDQPRREARFLILMYMGFSLIAFFGGGYLEIKKMQSATAAEMDRTSLKTEKERADQAITKVQSLQQDAEKTKAMLNKIVGQIGMIDGYLGGKYQAEADKLANSDFKTVLFFTNGICREITNMKKLVQPDVAAQCKIKEQ